MSFDSLIYSIFAIKRAIGTTIKSAIGFIGAITLIGEMNWKVIALGSALSGLTSIVASIITSFLEVDN